MYRQGDILIVPVSGCVRKGEEVKPEGSRTILARGEATGHHHSVASNSAKLFQTAVMGVALLEVHRRVQLLHQEHSQIELPPGEYLVKRQREHTPEGERWVAD